MKILVGRWQDWWGLDVPRGTKGCSLHLSKIFWGQLFLEGSDDTGMDIAGRGGGVSSGENHAVDLHHDYC